MHRLPLPVVFAMLPPFTINTRAVESLQSVEKHMVHATA